MESTWEWKVHSFRSLCFSTQPVYPLSGKTHSLCLEHGFSCSSPLDVSPLRLQLAAHEHLEWVKEYQSAAGQLARCSSFMDTLLSMSLCLTYVVPTWHAATACPHHLTHASQWRAVVPVKAHVPPHPTVYRPTPFCEGDNGDMWPAGMGTKSRDVSSTPGWWIKEEEG